MTQEPLRGKIIFFTPIAIFAAYTIWWAYMLQHGLDSTRNMRQIWGATYQILALYGGVFGIVVSRKWGGYKSLLGRTILAFSLGLFLQSFGQTYSSYYVFANDVESPPYPAIGDIGFFGSVIAYIYGVMLLSRITGTFHSLRHPVNKVMALVVPVLVLFVSYWYFLRSYEFDWSHALTVMLDFGYPIGQALYVSIAIILLIVTRSTLGGMLRKPILSLVFALVFQYISDFWFMYQVSYGTWYVGNINDFLYSASYLLMALCLIQLGFTFRQISNS